MSTPPAVAPVLVFGGVGGIGEALARRLCASGRNVVVTARDQSRAQALADEIGARAIACDVLDEASIHAAVAFAAPAGQLGGLVYAVGSIMLKPLARTTTGRGDLLTLRRVRAAPHITTLRAYTRPQ